MKIIFSPLLAFCFLGNSQRKRTWHHHQQSSGRFRPFMQHQSNGSIDPADNSVGSSETTEPGIATGGDFLDLVIDSTIFADKSLLIKAVIEDKAKGLLITMPRRWGKTVNLDMLRRFLEIPVNNRGEVTDKNETINYKTFKKASVLQPDGNRLPLKISQTNIKIKDPQHFQQWTKVNALELQGTFPVIYMTLKGCGGHSFNTIRRSLIDIIYKCFAKHGYLENSDKLENHMKEKVRSYLYSPKSLDDTEIYGSLLFLSEMLFRHHDKKVWILIDEYDAALNAAYQSRRMSRDDLDDTIELFKNFFDKTLKDNDFLEKSVITGIQFVAKASAGSGLNNQEKIDITTAKYAPYYGISQEEFDLFCEHFGVPEVNRKGAKEWYNGYTVEAYDQALDQPVEGKVYNRYNVWSIVHYLKNKKFSEFRSYWEKSGSINFIKDLLKAPAIREKIEQLVMDKDGKPGVIQFRRESDFDDDDFTVLKQLIGGDKAVTPTGVEVLLSYLFIVGYLTPDGLNSGFYRIPNMETKYEMRERLFVYYREYIISPNKVNGLINTLQGVIDNDAADQNHLESLLTMFYGQFKSIVQDIKFVNEASKEGVLGNENIVHSILNYIALQTQHVTMGSEVFTTKLNSDNKGRADLKITKGRVGAIIEVKGSGKLQGTSKGQNIMKGALDQAIDYAKLLSDQPIKVFLAVNVVLDEGDSQETRRSIELLCAYDMAGTKNIFGMNSFGEKNSFGVDTGILERLEESSSSDQP